MPSLACRFFSWRQSLNLVSSTAIVCFRRVFCWLKLFKLYVEYITCIFSWSRIDLRRTNFLIPFLHFYCKGLNFVTRYVRNASFDRQSFWIPNSAFVKSLLNWGTMLSYGTFGCFLVCLLHSVLKTFAPFTLRPSSLMISLISDESLQHCRLRGIKTSPSSVNSRNFLSKRDVDN